MRRVVYLSDARYEGGAERYLVRLAGSLDRGRFEPTLILPDNPLLDGLAGRAGRAGIGVLRMAAGGFAGARSPWALRNLLRQARPDLVHLNLPSTYDLACGWAALPARWVGSRAVVSTEHIVDLAPSRRRVLAKRMALRWTDRVIAISRKHRNLLASRHGVPSDKIHVIYNGVEDPGTPRHRPGCPLTILCVGALEERKGQDILVDGLARLRARGVDALLTLVGDGPLRGLLEDRARGLGVAEWVRFAGRLDSAASEIGAAHILAVPSRAEGIPFVILEAMAGGAVVAASALPGMEEVVDGGRNGLLLPPGDTAAWIEALARLAADAPERERLAARARQDYEARFTLGRMVRETEALYDEVLEGGAGLIDGCREPGL